MPTTVQGKPALGFAEFVFLMAMLTSLVALSIDAMLPALDRIGADLRSASEQQTHLIISLFFFGMAFGQLVFGPLADAKGRRTAILGGLAVFMFGTLVCYLANSMHTLLLGRMLQAFGASGPRIATMALIRDQYEGNAMARVMSFIMVIFILVPMLAPLFGQLILALFNWRHIFTAFFVIACLLALWLYSRQPETLPPSKRRPFTWRSLGLSTLAVLKHKAVMGYTLAMGCVFGAFLAYLSASQTLFVGIYGVGDWFPACFALLAFSIGMASFINGRVVGHYGMWHMSRIAVCGQIVMAAILTVSCVYFAGIPPLWMTLLELFALFGCVGVLFGNLNSMAMQPLGDKAGLGAAIIGSLSNVVAVPLAIAISAFVSQSLLPIALGFLVLGILAAVLLWMSHVSQQTA